eukprot:gnl/MRDRNA2_/MRDRNA2_95932_c0_seq1.p1 gnl/MRDRNA2_/MRDRNA2_95932_c0~~gnl/MRDRNA2_/MRDRNA2_95932_c0_seq1.p1  ORF type:complete len:713 (-),score=194.17 gnl/MRDRNA2_/MRDRNA2_95932_c0_seq1:254-2191(-)
MTEDDMNQLRDLAASAMLTSMQKGELDNHLTEILTETAGPAETEKAGVNPTSQTLLDTELRDFAASTMLTSLQNGELDNHIAEILSETTGPKEIEKAEACSKPETLMDLWDMRGKVKQMLRHGLEDGTLETAVEKVLSEEQALGAPENSNTECVEELRDRTAEAMAAGLKDGSLDTHIHKMLEDNAAGAVNADLPNDLKDNVKDSLIRSLQDGTLDTKVSQVASEVPEAIKTTDENTKAEQGEIKAADKENEVPAAISTTGESTKTEKIDTSAAEKEQEVPEATKTTDENTKAEQVEIEVKALSLDEELKKVIGPANGKVAFSKAREWLKARGLTALKTHLQEKGFVDHSDCLVTTGKPFNLFAMIAAGTFTQPGMDEEQKALGDFATRFAMACNRKENDLHWESSDPEWVGKASMSKRHRFLTTKDLKWHWFNALVLGLIEEAPQSASLDSVDKAIAEVSAWKAAALHYTKEMGWEGPIGLYFHSYPYNSVNSLHLHIVDLGSIGPTFDALNFKNLSIDDVLEVLEDERKVLASEHVSRCPPQAQPALDTCRFPPEVKALHQEREQLRAQAAKLFEEKQLLMQLAGENTGDRPPPPPVTVLPVHTPRTEKLMSDVEALQLEKERLQAEQKKLQQEHQNLCGEVL